MACPLNDFHKLMRVCFRAVIYLYTVSLTLRL